MSSSSLVVLAFFIFILYLAASGRLALIIATLRGQAPPSGAPPSVHVPTINVPPFNLFTST